MKYLLLCQFKPSELAAPPQALANQMAEAMISYNHQLIQAGVLVGAGQLAPPETAQRVFAENGRIRTEDGPALGDTVIGGYYLIDVPSEPEATGWAAKCPAAQFGSLEVRRVAFSPL